MIQWRVECAALAVLYAFILYLGSRSLCFDLGKFDSIVADCYLCKACRENLLKNKIYHTNQDLKFFTKAVRLWGWAIISRDLFLFVSFNSSFRLYGSMFNLSGKDCCTVCVHTLLGSRSLCFDLGKFDSIFSDCYLCKACRENLLKMKFFILIKI